MKIDVETHCIITRETGEQVVVDCAKVSNPGYESTNTVMVSIIMRKSGGVVPQPHPFVAEPYACEWFSFRVNSFQSKHIEGVTNVKGVSVST